jgi:uncharacterized membrane protein
VSYAHVMGFDLEAGVWVNSIAAILSVNQLVAYWLAGNKHQGAWWLGIAGGGPWLAFMILSGIWGMLPLVVGLQVIYIRNLVRWRREAREALPS